MSRSTGLVDRRLLGPGVLDRAFAPLEAGQLLVTWASGPGRAEPAEVAPAAERARRGGERHIGGLAGGEPALGLNDVGRGLLGPADVAFDRLLGVFVGGDGPGGQMMQLDPATLSSEQPGRRI